MLLCLSASRIYKTLSILIRTWKKKRGYWSLFFLVHPGRSPGKMLLFLNPSRIYNTVSIWSAAKKKNYAFVLYPFWFTQIEVLAWCYFAWALLGYITRLAFQSFSRKKTLGCSSISFLVHPGRSPGMLLLCLSPSRIYNKYLFSISIRSRKKKLGSCSISFLVHSGRSPGMMLLSLSASRIYNTFSILILSRKKKLGSCSISFLVHPDRSPGMMFLFLCASRIYSTFSISILIQKKKISLLFYIFSGSSR